MSDNTECREDMFKSVDKYYVRKSELGELLDKCDDELISWDKVSVYDKLIKDLQDLIDKRGE